MGLIVFEVHAKGKRVLQSISRELLWYEWAPKDEDGNPLYDEDGNEIQGTMHKMQGGRLDFKYDSREKKLKVGTAPVKVTTYAKETNEKEIDQWIQTNAVELKLTKVNGVGITVNFPDDKKDQVKDALDGTTFNYEIV